MIDFASPRTARARLDSGRRSVITHGRRMHHAPSRRVRLCRAVGGVALVATAALAACEHTTPFTPLTLGDFVLRLPRAGGRVGGQDASWTTNGRGIVYLGACLTPETVRGTHGAPSLMALSTDSTKPWWEMCEGDVTLHVPPDSGVRFDAIAMDGNGRILYEESATVRDSIAFPAFTETDLWLTDSSYPFTRRQKLLQLAIDSIGSAPVPATTVNWLTNLAWVDDTTFIAVGEHVPPVVGAFRPTVIGLVRGTISPTATTLAAIAGANGASTYSLAASNHTVVFSRGSPLVEQSALAGGAPALVTTIPGTDATVVALSCKQQRCLALVREPDSTGANAQAFWSLSLADGTATPAGPASSAIVGMGVSPSSNVVVVQDSSGWSLNGALWQP
jgi:hypothetical protein